MKCRYIYGIIFCLILVPFIILFTNISFKKYKILKYGNKGLIILLSSSIETVLSDKYYQSIGPYVDDYTIATYTLPYHNMKYPLVQWSNRDMKNIIKKNNKMIDIIIKDYPIKPVILSGISRGGYLSAMYTSADYYFLFVPVIDWNQLNEWKGKNKINPMPSFKNDTIYYIYASKNDNRVNGTYVINYVKNQCHLRNCDIVIGNTKHNVPLKIFKESVKNILN